MSTAAMRPAARALRRRRHGRAPVPGARAGEAFQRLDPRAEVFFVGAKRGVEARVLPERGVPHTLLPFEPIRRSQPWENWRLGPALVGARRSGCAGVFREFRPDLVVGTGGYASGPAVAWALLRGVPTACRSRTRFPGSPRAGSPAASGRSTSRSRGAALPQAGPRTEVFEFGNPIRRRTRRSSRRGARGLRPRRRAGRAGRGGEPGRAGGQRGAAGRPARAWSRGACPPAPTGWRSCGRPARRTTIASPPRGGLGVGRVGARLPYIQEMPRALAAADLAVSRAGAMALAELCAWGIPSVLVPLPTAAANHQHHNAVALADAGAASLPYALRGVYIDPPRSGRPGPP
jgi:UDP-N-acetylglucosamine--N-acetylmuramyl-(pentapeptide) pyrophosphoryl-undecaprenol N-acetylglucosamine transferase